MVSRLLLFIKNARKEKTAAQRIVTKAALLTKKRDILFRTLTLPIFCLERPDRICGFLVIPLYASGVHPDRSASARRLLESPSLSKLRFWHTPLIVCAARKASS